MISFCKLKIKFSFKQTKTDQTDFIYIAETAYSELSNLENEKNSEQWVKT